MLPSVELLERILRFTPVPLVPQISTSLIALNIWNVEWWSMQNTVPYSPVPLSVLCMTLPPPSPPRRHLSQAPEELTQVAATLLTDPSKPAHRCHTCRMNLRQFTAIRLWTGQGHVKLSACVLQMRLWVTCSRSAFIAEYTYMSLRSDRLFSGTLLWLLPPIGEENYFPRTDVIFYLKKRKSNIR